MTSGDIRTSGTMAPQHKSGLGGAGNTVSPRPNHWNGVAMDKPTVVPDSSHVDRLNGCPCPWCAPPSREPVRLGDALPDVLAEMRRREGR